MSELGKAVMTALIVFNAGKSMIPRPCPAFESFLTEGMDCPAQRERVSAPFRVVHAGIALQHLIEKHGSDYGLVWVERSEELLVHDPSENLVLALPELFECPEGGILLKRDVCIDDAQAIKEPVA